jgi:membrane fusion protein, epimerase transport system
MTLMSASRMLTTELLTLPADDDGHATHIVRKGVFSIVVLLGGFMLWATLAPLNGAIITEGIVKIDSNRKTVQHLEGGIVKQILVHEGSLVEKNQPLILLEDTTSSSNLNIIVDQLSALRAKEARLLAEASLKDKVTYPGELLRNDSGKIQEILRNEDALFQAKRKLVADQVALIKDQINEANAAITGYGNEVRAIEDGVRYSQDQLTASEPLLKKGFIEKTQLWNVQRTLAEKRERLGAVQGQLALQRESVAELQLRIINLRNEYAKQAGDELKDTRKLMYEQEERYRPAKDAQQRQTINAPIAGQVINLKVSTEQGVIKPGEALMDIVPSTQELILESRVSTKDIDSVHLHQRAEIQLSAFNQRTTPMISGEVIYVSGDALADEHASPPQYHYLAHIKVDKDSLKAVSKVSLAPGMPVVAYIQTHARTFSEYVLSPLVDRTRRTFKEE